MPSSGHARLAAALGLLLAAALLGAIPTGQGAAQGPTDCPANEEPSVRPGEAAGGTAVLELSSPQNPPVRFDFDHKRGSSDRRVSLRATPAIPLDARIAAEVEGDLYRADGGDSFPAEAIFLGQPTVTSGGRVVSFPICLDSTIEMVEEGRYIGTIQLTGDEIGATAVPIEVTLRAPRMYAIVAITLGLIGGLLLKTLGDWRKEPRSSLTGFVKRSETAYAVAIGLLVGCLSYVALYQSNDTWGTGEDWVKLAMVGISAQVTGMTAYDIVKGRG